MSERFSFRASPPRFIPPPSSCDCHIHVFGPAARYPMVEGRRYTPLDALPDDAVSIMDTLGLERVVLVQPSTYGTDNRCMLDAMAALAGRARGVAVVSDNVKDGELRALHDAGVRGVRLNFATLGRDDFAGIWRETVRMAERVRPLGWHLQLFVGTHILEPVAAEIETLGVDVVFDHMANIPVSLPDRELTAVRLMLATGRCWVKLSGVYRVNGGGADYAPVAALARALTEANPDRVVWGSDWPHTPPHGDSTVGGAMPFRSLDTGHLLDLLANWVPDEEQRTRILVDNPHRLYDFD